MDILKDKKDEIRNTVKILIGFSFIVGVLFLFFSVLILINVKVINLAFYVTIVCSFVSFFVAFLAYKGFLNLSKFIIIFFPPYAIVFSSVLVKVNNAEFSNVYTYLTPKLFCVIYFIAPIIFFGIRQKNKMILSFVLLIPTILFFDLLHDYFGILFDELPYVHRFVPLFFVMVILFYSLALVSLLLFQKTNLIYREKVEKQHQEMFHEKEEIRLLNDKLKFQSNLYGILNIVSKKKILYFMLQDVLEEILSIESLKIEEKGLIFLTNEEGDLEMAAHKNVSSLTSLCALVKKGQCLCGEVLESKQKMFCNSVGHNHTTVPEGMKPHGHYVIPIKDKGAVLGVINIYIKEGEAHDSDIEAFLEAVAIILSRRIILHKTDESLKKKSIALTHQSKIVKETLFELHQSIEYAEFLQKSLIPNSETINTFFEESSVLYLPKDKVSGDFYFAHEMGDNLYFGVGDCTGHGIPGGFLAAMSIEAVKTTIQNMVGAKPSIVLEELRIVAKERFSVNFGDKRSDSMDAALCMYSKKDDVLYFSGGFMNLIIIRNGIELLEFKATKCPIGSYPVEPQFELNRIELQKGDVIYITSDGYIDQFGVVEGKSKPTKLKRKKYRELILRNTHLSCDEQTKLLNQYLLDWRGDIEQIDDVTVFIARH